MAVNNYFQTGSSIGSTGEQNLVESLIIEGIQISGFDLFYLPRSSVNDNDILNEDTLNKYDNYFQLEMQIISIDGFEGDGTLLTKFGIEIRDSASFLVSIKRWNDEIGKSNLSQLQTRPTEGDIIYFPLTKAFLEITNVDAKNPFFQLSKLYTYKLDCELMRFSHERFSTGMDEIDDIANSFSLDINSWNLELEDESGCLLLENGSKLILEEYSVIGIDKQSQNEDIDELSQDLIFSENNPFSEPLVLKRK